MFQTNSSLYGDMMDIVNLRVKVSRRNERQWRFGHSNNDSSILISKFALDLHFQSFFVLLLLSFHIHVISEQQINTAHT